MPNLFTKLIIEPGTKMRLGDIFPGIAAPVCTRLPRRRSSLACGGMSRCSCPIRHQEFLVEPGSRVKLSEIDPGLPRKARVG